MKLEHGVVYRLDGQKEPHVRSHSKAKEEEPGLTPSELEKALDCLRGLEIRDVAIGFKHFLALTEQGQVYAFGGNHYGQLGLGHIRTAYEPTPVAKLSNRFLSSPRNCFLKPNGSPMFLLL